MLPRGFESVTTAPGRTAPEVSVTLPPIAPTPCACAGAAENNQRANPTQIPISVLPVWRPPPRLGAPFLGQRKREDRVARHDGDVLAAFDRVADGGRVNRGAELHVPQVFAGVGVERDEVPLPV